MKILLLLQVSFITILVVFSNYTSGQCLEDQKALLIKFKNNLTFDSSVSTKLVMWDESSIDCCQWPGVSCDEEGHVLVLELDSEAISGGIEKSSSLFHLRYLEKLNLAYNGLYPVPIPREIYKLANLMYLNLSHSFNGQIPMELSRLIKLEILDLSGGDLKLERPDLKTLVGNLANLRELYLDRVNISLKGSEWCSALSSSLPQLRVLSMRDYFTKLTILSVRWCYLFGPFPSKIFQVPTLQQLDLSGNENLTGILPEFPHKSALREVVLSYTGFTGSLPDSIANLRNLTQLDLGSCNFSGEIPSKMGNLTELVHLDLSFNSFTGSIPLFHKAKKLNHIDLSNNNGPLSSAQTQLAVLLSLPSLQYLSVQNSQLSGEIHEFPNASSSVLEMLDLSNNHLSGSIPRSIFKLNRLSKLFLFSNSFSGTIVIEAVKGLPRLTTLDLSNNKIEGEIPSWVWTVGNLNLSHNLLESLEKPHNLYTTSIVIDLSSNKIKGDIPILPTSLTYFSIANNEFTGSIHSSIYSLDTLQILDMSNNKLSGIIPDIFPLNWNLKTLNLSSNILEGKVPSSLEKCSFLEVLDIGNNKIRDMFPCMLNKLANLRVLVIRSNKFYGNLQCLRAEQTWPMIHIIDIASNNFHEEIPETLGNLILLIHLNFSHNALTGRIPNAIGKLTLLESLDLSVNQLSGRIPDEIASFTFLSFLNLSFNQLSGRIPSGNQLQTFSADSFEGNIGLCDFPLKKTCSDTKETEREIDGKYISFALGSSVGFGIITWLILHSRKYNELVDILLFRILGQHQRSGRNKNQRRSR
ncbi:probably inactive leucine-rich repeat receptor-like protein kinase At2g25790 isoform X1 [Solanum tuberosum]|uniref:probably inactive leucine-rich repeat receptor-like protein kinase At2g25790 isoform X1 n=1 Tax=Solanum tuberosum TaxID=4113 RepID=UPI00073A3D25|nr:PREDICTED: probably inactive leucine-rich repeat receptor-like protein kinase At2g25790 isoform X1 [Solanum tuberosum]